MRAAGSDGEVFDADLTDGSAAEQLVERVLARFGRLDGLVNNAGRTQVGPFLDLDPTEWDAVIRTDLTAAFHTCRAALPSMLERGAARSSTSPRGWARWGSARPRRTARPRPA